MIQAGLDQDWPDAVKEAVDPFKQGDLIERPPLFYAASPRHPLWSASRILAEEAAAAGEQLEDEEIIDLHPEQRPPWGMITSQTCEIVEERPQPLQPWVQVAPVYPCAADSPLRNRDFILGLSPPELDGDWVLDLRLEVALEKSILVGRDPVEAFAAEADYHRLATLLAQRRGRPALHAVFHEVMTGLMNEIKVSDKPSRKRVRAFRDEIYGLKLGIEDGSRLDPVSARLYVLTEGLPSEQAKAWFGEWWDLANERSGAAGLNLLPTTWIDTRNLEISLRRYDELIDLRNPF